MTLGGTAPRQSTTVRSASSTIRSRYRRRLVIAAAILGVLLAAQWPLSRSLASAGFINRPESFTELSFADPDHVTAIVEHRVPADGAPFVLTNREGRPVVYHWVVRSISRGLAHSLAAGSASLANNESRAIDPAASLRRLRRGTVIEVVLTNRSERIAFRIADPLATPNMHKANR